MEPLGWSGGQIDSDPEACARPVRATADPTADATCDTTLDAIVRSIRYAVDLVGVDHVALGSNFDGGRATPIDAAGLAHLTQTLMAAGFTEDDIARIAGANAWRLLRSLLPD